MWMETKLRVKPEEARTGTQTPTTSKAQSKADRPLEAGERDPGGSGWVWGWPVRERKHRCDTEWAVAVHQIHNLHPHFPGVARLSHLLPVVKLPRQEWNQICPSAPALGHPPSPRAAWWSQTLRWAGGSHGRETARTLSGDNSPLPPQVFGELAFCDSNPPSWPGSGGGCLEKAGSGVLRGHQASPATHTGCTTNSRWIVCLNVNKLDHTSVTK